MPPAAAKVLAVNFIVAESGVFVRLLLFLFHEHPCSKRMSIRKRR